ncbi:DNA polymerase III subunit psi [Psychromonas sp. Urea-02u-13]|uniref:DNA polymerase III subunit psi n=1 Tax=Psychromonas sp. Urea-02u-13 TaxID=2058326 RepID=UPI000C33FB89|nr:DNA polymerase III subunit psi [Psychromonas sp. Urea-02u-13]PKG40656.1 DNA polymerase III subunit psi [Psychromonas sp. Urea-02u-13]
MLHQKALYLQEMGITHWQVRKPALFAQGSGFPMLDLSECNLLFICAEGEFEHPLTLAILKAFNIKESDVCCCSLEQFENQQGNLPAVIWSTLGDVKQVRGHGLLTSPSITQLTQLPHAKKQLWEQFCALQ